MTKVLNAIVRREFKLAFSGSFDFALPLLFGVMVISLFPLGVSPGPEMLQKIGAGVIWVSAILASLLGLEKLFREDFRDGSLEQLRLSGQPFAIILLVKVIVHWLITVGPILILSPLFALFLNLTPLMFEALFLTLLLGTPMLSLVGAIAVALTLSLEKGGILLALLMLPLFIPLLIFATSAVNNAQLQLNYSGQLGIIAAMLMLALALTPWAISFAVKVSQN